MQDEQGKRRPLSWFSARFFLPLFIFCWPFLYLFRYVFPINGRLTGIYNDFIGLYFVYKLYLLSHLASFSFPLWSPSEGAGFPFYANPFAQAFYPLNLLLIVWYKLFGGYNVLDYTIFTILGISIFALGLYKWLRLVNANIRAVIFSVLVMSVSFKMTEILRLPNAVHSAAWYPWILYAVTKIMFSKCLKSSIFGGILLTFFMICLCTAGYPYYLYYCPFLFVPYVAAFMIKPLRCRLFGEGAIRWRRVFVTLVIAGFVVLLVCGPYLLAIRNLMSETTDRTGKDFEYSTRHVFNAEDTLGSLVYPPNAQAEGWYFFSITAFLLIMLYLFSGNAKKFENQLTDCEEHKEAILPSFGDPWVKLFFVIWIGLISYISYGRYSHLFVLLWNYMPGFSSLRVWGRFNIILIPIFAWMLSFAYASFESIISCKAIGSVGKYRRLFSPIALLVLIYSVVVSIQLFFYLNDINDPYWKWFFKNLSAYRIRIIICGGAAFAIILLFIGLSKRVKFRRTVYLKIVLASLFLFAAFEMSPIGTQTWVRQVEFEESRINLDLDMAKINKASFQFRRMDRTGTIFLGPNFNVGTVENWYFDRYVKFLEATSGELHLRNVLLGIQDGSKIFFSESIKHETIKMFLSDAVRHHPAGQLLFYDGDELVWEIDAPVAGYLSFIDNWDRNWRASVDGQPVEIELLFGTFKSVKLSPGRRKVRFYYQPKIL